MDAIPSNLCTLVEQLEDARQFHDGAARQSDGPYRERHSARSRAYAMMLSEIRDWESRTRQPASAGDSAFCLDPSPLPQHDSYAALLERVYRIHSSVGPVGANIRIPATAGMDGHRTASSLGMGEAMRC